MRISVAMLMLAVSAMAATAAESQPLLHCATGSVTRSYGGTKWLVHSCTDGKSLVFTAAEGNPAAPFEFDLTYTGHGYDLDGKGTGKRAATDAAYADLQQLKAPDIHALVKATQAVKAD